MNRTNIPLKRKYDSSRRQAQARETRRQIVAAARLLFFERGYSGTTIDAIAQAAEVAPETVYATFGNKRKILSFLMDISIGGDDQPVKLLDRPEPQAVLHDADQKHQIKRFSQDIAGILERAAPVFDILRSAAKTEPEVSELLQHLLHERLDNMVVFARAVAANGGLRDGLEVAAAAELIWTITSPEVFLLLTRDRGFSLEKYTAWLESTLARLLLP